jgi:hypothetical protein
MFDVRTHYQSGEGQYWCEFERSLKGEYCGKRGQLTLDGLLLCEAHAQRLRLEERVAYCRAMLAHIELWSREARTRGREDIVDLLGIERTNASAALGRILLLEDLERVEGDGASGDGRGGDTGRGADGKDGKGGDGKVIPLWPPLLLLFLSLAVRRYAL